MCRNGNFASEGATGMWSKSHVIVTCDRSAGSFSTFRTCLWVFLQGSLQRRVQGPLRTWPEECLLHLPTEAGGSIVSRRTLRSRFCLGCNTSQTAAMISVLKSDSLPRLFPADSPDLWIFPHLKKHLKQDYTFRMFSNLETDVYSHAFLPFASWRLNSSILGPRKEGQRDSWETFTHRPRFEEHGS